VHGTAPWAEDAERHRRYWGLPWRNWARSNLVAGDTNHRSDVFVRDRVAQVTRRVSVG
jgi:hypothetical protein